MKQFLEKFFTIWLTIEILLLVLVLCIGFTGWLLQVKTNYPFVDLLKKLYINGSIGTLVAWRAHIGLLLVTGIYGVIELK